MFDASIQPLNFIYLSWIIYLRMQVDQTWAAEPAVAPANCMIFSDGL